MPPASKDTHEITLDDGDDSDGNSEDETGPAPPSSSASAAQPKRVMGPAPPPASLSERAPSSRSPQSAHPNANSDPDSEDDDDDYGPALPGSSSHLHKSRLATAGGADRNSLSDQTSQQPKRDDWMLAPPPASTGYQERDPTKIKSRKFASSGASATKRRPGEQGGGVSSIWTETPEEKVKRLKDAVLGRGDTSQQPPTAGSSRTGGGGGGKSESHGNQQHHQQHDQKITAFTEQTRGKSLYEEHQAAKKAGKALNSGGGKKGGQDPDEEDDDPSKRAFDREKDMGLGGKISASQRKKLVNQAGDFGGRFQRGNYL